MANLLGFDIGSNYQGIINLGTVGTPGSGINQPLTAVATGYKVVTDGTGTGSPLQLATDAVKIASTLNVDINIFAGTVFANAVSAGGTAGAGYFEGAYQSVAPTGKVNFSTLWFDSTGRLNWKPATGFSRTFDASGISANTVYTLPSATSTLASLNLAQTFTIAQAISISSTAATALNAISLQAGTAATSVVTAQWSPTAFFSANAWNTTGAGSSVTVGFRMFARSVGNSTNPTSSFVLEGTNDGTTFTEALTISTGGVFTFRNSVALGFATGILNIMNQNQQNVTRVNFGPNNAATTPALAVVTTSATGDTLSAIDSRTSGAAAVFLRGKLSTSAAYVNTTVTPTGYLVIFDSTGTSYRIPAVAGA